MHRSLLWATSRGHVRGNEPKLHSCIDLSLGNKQGTSPRECTKTSLIHRSLPGQQARHKPEGANQNFTHAQISPLGNKQGTSPRGRTKTSLIHRSLLWATSKGQARGGEPKLHSRTDLSSGQQARDKPEGVNQNFTHA